jgi:hypothetical protein
MSMIVAGENILHIPDSAKLPGAATNDSGADPGSAPLVIMGTAIHPAT